jgi:hypothetical protein
MLKNNNSKNTVTVVRPTKESSLKNKIVPNYVISTNS